MAKYQLSRNSSQLDYAFGALSDPTRRSIIERLTTNDMTVTEIANAYRFSLPTISKHLSVLERAKLIRKNRMGRTYRVYFQPEAMKEVSEYVSFYRKFWHTQLNNLEKFLINK